MPTPLTITAANSVYMLAILGLFPTPQQLSGFAADAAFDTGEIDTKETVMGVDAQFSAGWVPAEQTQNITIMPDSPSALMFEAWYSAELAAQELYWAAAVITLPGVGRSYICSKGVLKNYKPLANVAKTLRARPFSIVWGSIVPQPS